MGNAMNHHEKENTHAGLAPDAKETAIMKEMLPFAIYAAIPIIITIALALTFGVS